MSAVNELSDTLSTRPGAGEAHPPRHGVSVPMELRLRDYLAGHILREGMMVFERVAGPWAKRFAKQILCGKLGYDPADDDVQAAQHAKLVSARRSKRAALEERRAALEKELRECPKSHKPAMVATRSSIDAELKTLAADADLHAPVPRWVESCRAFFGPRLRKHVHAGGGWDVVIIAQVVRALLPELAAAKAVPPDAFEAKALLGGILRVAEVRNQRAHLGVVTEPEVLEALSQMAGVLRLCSIDSDAAATLIVLLDKARALVDRARRSVDGGAEPGPEMTAEATNAQILYTTLAAWEVRVETRINCSVSYENGTVVFGRNLAPAWCDAVKRLKPQLRTVAAARHWYFHHLDGECDVAEALAAMTAAVHALEGDSSWPAPTIATGATPTTLRLSPPGTRMQVPVARVGPTFVGRDNTVTEVAKALAPGVRLLLHGIPGVGKDTVMAEVAHQPEVHALGGLQAWVQASSDAILLRQLVALFQNHRPNVVAGIVAEDGTVHNAAAVTEAIAQWLAAHNEWVLFVEDAKPSSHVLWDVLPRDGRGGCAVVSSQSTLADRSFTTRHELLPISTDESVELLRRARVFASHAPDVPNGESEDQLRRRCNEADAAHVYSAPSPDGEKAKTRKQRHRQIAEQLHEHVELQRPELRHFLETTLGNLPLSVAMCSHTIRATPQVTSVADLVNLYRRTHDLGAVDRVGRNPMRDTHFLGLSKSVQVAVARLRDDVGDGWPRADREAAIAVLTAVSVLDRTKTPNDILLPEVDDLSVDRAWKLIWWTKQRLPMSSWGLSTKPVCRDRGTLDRARNLCARYGLLQLPESENTVGVMHQLVQRCLRYALIANCDEGVLVAQQVRESLLRRFCYHQGASQGTRRLCWLLASSVRAWWDAVGDERDPPAKEVSDPLLDCHLLFTWALFTLDADGDGVAAAEVLEAVIAVYKRVLPPRDDRTVAAMSVLASAYDRQGRHDKAFGIEEEVLKLRAGPDPLSRLSRAVTLNNLADTLMMQDRYNEALPHLREALEIRTALLPTNDRVVAQSVGYLGRALRSLGRQTEAHEYIAKAARILESIDPVHEDYGTALIDLGQSCQALGQMLAARDHLERALWIYRQRLAHNHSFIGTALTELGTVYLGLDDYEDQLVVERAALRLRRSALPPNHPHVKESIFAVRMAERFLSAADPTRRDATSAFDRIPPKTPVVLHGLISAPAYNGSLGRVEAFDAVIGRYRIAVEGGRTLSCKPSNLLQLVTGVDVLSCNERGRIVGVDKTNGLYSVRLLLTADTVALPLTSVKLPANTRVELRGIRSRPELNGQWVQVRGYDCECDRYIVQVNERGACVKIKRDAVVL